MNKSLEEIMSKKKKIVMMTMFKNEAKTIRRMLESCYKYIDYYVIQDNGSTDGTPEIVKEFFADKDIPGFVYKCEEGWISFGWNRDHLLQTCLKTNHNCDWILKMDCDEVLEVDEDFDWSNFDDTTIHSFHVTAVLGSTYYYRAWIYNAKLNWKFNHDTAHETIELLDDNIGGNFTRIDLPKSFRQRGGFEDGESYSNPYKYICDALRLEEKLLKENTMLTNLYHFWYIAKSYFDGFRAHGLPLKDNHAKHYAWRCIFYCNEYLNFTHDFFKDRKAKCIDEMAYYAMFMIGHCYLFLKDYNSALQYFHEADSFCPKRNDHIISIAETFLNLKDYKKALHVTKFLIQPERVNPFPECVFLIDENFYHDTGTYVHELHQKALNLNNENIFELNDE